MILTIATAVLLTGCGNHEKSARLEYNNTVTFYEKNPQGNYDPAISRLEAIIKKYPETTAATDAQTEKSKIQQEGLQRALDAGSTAFSGN